MSTTGICKESGPVRKGCGIGGFECIWALFEIYLYSPCCRSLKEFSLHLTYVFMYIRSYCGQSLQGNTGYYIYHPGI